MRAAVDFGSAVASASSARVQVRCRFSASRTVKARCTGSMAIGMDIGIGGNLFRNTENVEFAEGGHRRRPYDLPDIAINANEAINARRGDAKP
jgi:hypothetical protein